jgi:hypothetical protein
MERKMSHLLNKAYAVTSNDIKRHRLEQHSRPFVVESEVFERSLINAVGLAEGMNRPVLKDNNSEEMFVVQTSRKKALGMIPLVRKHFLRTGDSRLFYSMDSVYTFRQKNGNRFVVNKPDSRDKMIQFYKNRAGDLFYSTSSVHFVYPSMDSIPFAALIKIRLGTWTGDVSSGFVPDRSNALGMTLDQAVNLGFVKPDMNAIKIELITFDYQPSALDRKLIPSVNMVQKNYQVHLPYDEVKNDLHAIAVGVVPDDILGKLGKPIRIQRFMRR